MVERRRRLRVYRHCPVVSMASSIAAPRASDEVNRLAVPQGLAIETEGTASNLS